MPLRRDLLPDPVSYYESRGLTILKGRGTWRAANCPFCASTDNFNIDTSTGGFHCWSCPARGGDVLAFEMAHAGMDFITAAKALGAWEEDPSRPMHHSPRPTPLSAAQRLELLAEDVQLCAICLSDVVRGREFSEADLHLFMQAAGRITHVARM